MKERIQQIRESLATAFGGYSQYGLQVLGQALAGQINNNGLEGSVTALCAEAARQVCDRWEDQDEADTAASTEAEIAASIEAACRSALERLGVWHDKMPAPVDLPSETPRRERGARGGRGARPARDWKTITA